MFTSGFFNSINSDRKYNAEQMAAIFDGLITDGIFDSIGDHFQVTPASSGLGVNIGTGRAWLNQTWSHNDTAYPVTLGAASSSLGRKDLICLKVDKSSAVRSNSLVVIAGTPAASPVEPTVTDDTTNGIYYHKLAAVTVPKGATSISAANIQNYIGLSTGTPYVTGILSSTTVDELWSQWDGEFNDWWDDIKATLDDNIVTTILNKIDHITPKEATMNLYGFSHINPPPSGMEYKEYSTDAILNQISNLLNKKYVFIKNQKNVNLSKGDFYATGKEYTGLNTSIFVAFSTFEVVSDGIKPLNFNTYTSNMPSGTFLQTNAGKFVYWKVGSTTFSEGEVIPTKHVLSNKYYTSTSNGYWIFIPSSNTSVNQGFNNKFSMSNCWNTAVDISSTVLGTYTSTDPNAYSPLIPPTCGGIWYDRYNQEGYATVQKRAVTYSGSDPITIAFNEIPKILFIYANSSYSEDNGGIYICIATDTGVIIYSIRSGSGYVSVNVTDDAIVSFKCTVASSTGYGLVYAIY